MRMKLGKTSLLLLAVGIVIITFTSLGVTRAQQLQEQDKVNEELSLVTWRLNTLQVAQLRSQYEDLENQLSQTTLRFEAVRAALARPIGSIDASDTLFSIANSCGVELNEIISLGQLSSELEGIPCSVLALSVSIEGGVPNLISFVDMVNGNFVTGTVESVQIHIPDNTAEQRSTARIKLIIYTCQGE